MPAPTKGSAHILLGPIITPIRRQVTPERLLKGVVLGVEEGVDQVDQAYCKKGAGGGGNGGVQPGEGYWQPDQG